MLTNKLLTISLLLPLMAASASAHAGSTITDKSYWPNEARQSTQARTGSSQRDLNSAFAYDLTPSERIVGSFDTTLMPHFLESLAQTGRLTLHVTQLRGGNPHHLLEATMKALGRVIDAASRRDPRRKGQIPSSKGRIGA